MQVCEPNSMPRSRSHRISSQVEQRRLVSVRCVPAVHAADEVCHDEDGGREPVPLEPRPGLLEEVAVAVVEREQDTTPWQAAACPARGAPFLESDVFGSRHLAGCQLFLEVPGRDAVAGGGVRPVRNATPVVHENGQPSRRGRLRDVVVARLAATPEEALRHFRLEPGRLLRLLDHRRSPAPEKPDPRIAPEELDAIRGGLQLADELQVAGARKHLADRSASVGKIPVQTGALGLVDDEVRREP